MVKKQELEGSGLGRDVTVLDGTTLSTIQSFRGEVEENFQDKIFWRKVNDYKTQRLIKEKFENGKKIFLIQVSVDGAKMWYRKHEKSLIQIYKSDS